MVSFVPRLLLHLLGLLVIHNRFLEIQEQALLMENKATDYVVLDESHVIGMPMESFARKNKLICHKIFLPLVPSALVSGIGIAPCFRDSGGIFQSMILIFVGFPQFHS